jgi:hypothetical protein
MPRLDLVPFQHCSFGSDAAAARFACLLIELGIANPADWQRSAAEPARFLRYTLDRFIREHGEKEIDGAFELFPIGPPILVDTQAEVIYRSAQTLLPHWRSEVRSRFGTGIDKRQF